MNGVLLPHVAGLGWPDDQSVSVTARPRQYEIQVLRPTTYILLPDISLLYRDRSVKSLSHGVVLARPGRGYTPVLVRRHARTLDDVDQLPVAVIRDVSEASIAVHLSSRLVRGPGGVKPSR